jgi:hypothetical protein
MRYESLFISDKSERMPVEDIVTYMKERSEIGHEKTSSQCQVPDILAYC